MSQKFSPKTQENVKLWLQKQVLTVVYSRSPKGLGIEFHPKKTSFPKDMTFDYFLNNSLQKIQKFFDKHPNVNNDINDNDDEDEDWELDGQKLIQEIFPVFQSDKDDGGFCFDLFSELVNVVEQK